MNHRYVEFHRIIDRFIEQDLVDSQAEEFAVHQRECETCQKDARIRQAFIKVLEEELVGFFDKSERDKIP